MDKAAANRSLSTIHTELEYLRESELLTPEQYQSIMTQLPVRIICLSVLPKDSSVRTYLNSQSQVPLTNPCSNLAAFAAATSTPDIRKAPKITSAYRSSLKRLRIRTTLRTRSIPRLVQGFPDS